MQELTGESLPAVPLHPGVGSGTMPGLEQFSPDGRQLLAIYSMFKELPRKRV